MTTFLVLCFLFCVGSFLGWCTEVLFRRFCSAKKWINPGFLTGPYLPLYGFGLVGLFCICLIPINTGYSWLNAIITILIMGVVMTVIEYISGLIFIVGMKIKLWDYSDRWGNIQGIICPLFSFFWTVVGAIYYFLVNPFVLDWVQWFVNNIAFAFFVGIFFGVFIVDLAHTVNLTVRIRKFAAEHNVVVKYEKLKESIRDGFDKLKEKLKSEPSSGEKEPLPKLRFVFPFRTKGSLEQSMEQYLAEEEKKEEPDTSCHSDRA